jgi:hypothetical protein
MAAARDLPRGSTLSISIDEDHSNGDKDRGDGFLDQIPRRQIFAKAGGNDRQDNAEEQYEQRRGASRQIR